MNRTAEECRREKADILGGFHPGDDVLNGMNDLPLCRQVGMLRTLRHLATARAEREKPNKTH